MEDRANTNCREEMERPAPPRMAPMDVAEGRRSLNVDRSTFLYWVRPGLVLEGCCELQFNVGDCSSFRISISSENPTKIALAGSVRGHNGSVQKPSTIVDPIRQKTLRRIFVIPGPLPHLAIQC